MYRGNYKPEGDIKTARYIAVGDAPDKMGTIYGRPFAQNTPAGSVFSWALSEAGLNRDDFYITSVFDFVVAKDKKSKNILGDNGEPLFLDRTGFTAAGAESRERLLSELRMATNANCIIALGKPALAALTGHLSLGKHRGSVYKSAVDIKVIGTIHPAGALHGEYINRYYIAADLTRFRREAEFPELRRPQYSFTLAPTLTEIADFCTFIREMKPLTCVDIEVLGRSVSDIGLGISHERGLTIDFTKFTPEQEAEIWYLVSTILEDPSVPKLFQNGMFDTVMLLQQVGIICRGQLHDSMVAQRILYPEFKASLAVLCSLYTEPGQPYYKDMIKHGTVDKEDG